jgi:DNA-binding transcriptional LysR family regulator
MELQQLRHFVAVMENRTLQEAAHVLGLTQSAVTRSIQTLERDLGIELFNRDSRKTLPTQAGLEFFQHAKTILNSLTQAKEDALRVHRDHSGEVRLGISGHAANAAMNRAIADIATRFPAVNLRVCDGMFSQLMAQLQTEKLDVIYASPATSERDKDIIFRPLQRIQCGLFVRTTHPLANRKTVKLRDTINSRWLIDQMCPAAHFDRIFSRAGLTPPQQLDRTNSTSLIKSLVLKANYITWMDRDFFAQDIRDGMVKPLHVAEFEYEREAGLLWQASALLSPATLQVIETIMTTFQHAV